MQTKWDNFSEEEIKNILTNSTTYSEVQRKIGYKYHTNRNKKIKELANIYKIDISDYGSLENLKGETFNFLEVLDYNKVESKKHGRPYWDCRCKCGNITTISASSLKSGVKSCGCLRNKDLTGCENEYFIAISSTKKRKNGCVVWKGICKICQQETEFTSDQFDSQKSCGCTKYSNLYNKKFGKLLAIAPTENRKNRSVVWKCQCDCGLVCYVPAISLTSGNTKSCSVGCGHTTIKVGDVFGKLTVLKRNEQNFPGGAWDCQCECGNKIIVKGMLLVNGMKKSCGCLASIGNYQVRTLLDTLNLSYKTEYSFDNLKDKGKLRFDFAVFKNNILDFLIEYNGKQHYEPIAFFGGEETFLNQKFKDSLKQEYCKEHQIPLITFKYNETVNESNLLSKVKEAKECIKKN